MSRYFISAAGQVIHSFPIEIRSSYKATTSFLCFSFDLSEALQNVIPNHRLESLYKTNLTSVEGQNKGK